MSYAMAQALQMALYQHLTADPALSLLVGSAIYDALPKGAVPQGYVLLGSEQVRDRSDQTGAGSLHQFIVSVHSNRDSFSGSKQIAAAICDALVDAPLTLSRGQLIGLWFDRARARRQSAGGRSIELRFRARIEDD